MNSRNALRLGVGALLFVSSALSGAAQTPDLNDPAAQLASFQLAEGFEANLFASEKDGVIKPIQMRWDTRGRLWVIQSTTYPQLKPGEQPNDKVLILEDIDGDGRSDKTTVFADGLMIPMGIEIAPTQQPASAAYVGEGTKLWLMTDKDGDGKADEKQVVFRGFGTGDNHQNINSFRWSPGGELMFSQGLHARSRVETPQGIVALDEAGFFRYRPREPRLEGFFGGQSDPQNPFGFVYTDFGQPLIVAGNNGMMFDPLPEMIRGFTHGRRPSIWVDGRVRKTSGPDIVGTAHLPKEWQGVLLAGGYINNAVWSLKINEAGAGFSLTDLAPLVRSTHTSFRPVDVKIGPDGAIYLCDWYNPIIGHYQASFRHPDRDKAHGRIWRITYKGRPLVKPPQIAGAPVEALLENLKSGERYVREQSKRELAGRPTGEVVERLRTWWRALKTDDATTEAGLFEALGVFEAHETPEPDLLDRVLKSTIPHARAYAVGTVARWQDRLKRDPLEIITRLSRDEHPRVQLAAIVAAGNIPRQDSVQVILGAPDFGDDEFLRLAARTAAKVLEPHWKPWAAAGDPHWKPEWSERLALLQAEPAPKKPVEAKPAVALKDEPAAGKLRATADYVAALVAEVRADGDARAGAEVYQRSGCIACHAIDGKGGTIGPALDAIGSGQPLDFIIGATLEPQREIKESFEAVEVTAKDGRVLMGYIVGRDAQHLTVREPATETETRLPVAEIAGQRSIGSFMPAGLVDNLSRAELRDLFRYLADLGKPTLPGK